MIKFLRSSANAVRGVKFCLRERNFRIHIVVAAYVLFFSRYYKFDTADYALIILLIGAVMALEAVNTAIEAVVDKISPEYSLQAKIAKDTAAAAVLIMAVAAAVVGAVLFSESTGLSVLWRNITGGWIFPTALGISVVISGIFISEGVRDYLANAKKDANENGDT